MSIWSKLFGSDEVIQAGIDGVDKTFYTDEEKADNWAKFLALYEPFKIAQRWLAMTVCPPYVLLTVFTWLSDFISMILLYRYDKGLVTVPLHQTIDGNFGTAFWLILAFYFGGGALEGVVNRFKKAP